MDYRPTELDDRQFIEGLNFLDERVARGGKKAVAMLLAEAEKEAKANCPIRSGTLMASTRAQLAEIEVDAAGVRGKLAAGGGEASDYALVQHEVPMAHSHPVSGVYPSKWVLKGLVAVTPAAPAVIADQVRDAMRGGA